MTFTRRHTLALAAALAFAPVTARAEPHIEWMLETLAPQTRSGDDIELIVVDLHAARFIEALQGAGGLLLLLIALELLTGRDSSSDKSKDVNVALVPLGTPLLAGPGAIVTTIVFVQNAHTASMKFALAAAIVAVHLAIGLTLMFSTKIVSVIKESGVTLLARIAGLLLAAIAVEMIVQAIKGFFSL
jgi:MarC family membrane protein